MKTPKNHRKTERHSISIARGCERDNRKSRPQKVYYKIQYCDHKLERLPQAVRLFEIIKSFLEKLKSKVTASTGAHSRRERP